ncbi:cupin domain-containing protein [Granulosicoccus sp. 3-233]|uniref:cupin domain-containing protein n=1 Tax=Granulosicoccus sp. 3-233 TaxID=3417969 RepID=UPI003D33A5E1
MSDQRYLVTADDISQMPGVDKQHFLNANARRNNKSLGDLTGLTGFGVHLIDVPPGCESTEHHVHHHEDECVYVLSGEATACIGDEQFPISAGDFIGYRKGGLPHSLRNTGSEPLICLVVGERLAHDTGDYPKLGKRLYRSAALPWNLVEHEAIVVPESSAGAK